MKHFLCSLLCATFLPSIFGAEPAVGDKLKVAVARAQTERVAIIGIGDSNQRFGGHGYSAAMPRALSSIAPIYASDLLRYRQWKEKNGRERARAPEELGSLAYHWYVAPGETDSVGWQAGQLILPADHPIDVRGPLRFHLTYGTFEKGDSSFRPLVRRDSPPWTVLAQSAPVDPVTGGYGLARLTLDVPADSARDHALQFMPDSPKTPIRGPFFAAQAVAENTARRNGLAYHTLHGVGGQSLTDMFASLRGVGVEKLKTWFVDVRALLNGDKTAIVMIHSGLNDRNRKTVSIGPRGDVLTSSPEGYADNLEGMVRLLTEAWTAAGGREDALHFAFMPSHVLGEPDDPKLVSYRQAARTLAERLPNASMIDLPALVPYSEMLANRYYDKGRPTDAHLERAGYEAIANALARALKD